MRITDESPNRWGDLNVSLIHQRADCSRLYRFTCKSNRGFCIFSHKSYKAYYSISTSCNLHFCEINKDLCSHVHCYLIWDYYTAFYPSGSRGSHWSFFASVTFLLSVRFLLQDKVIQDICPRIFRYECTFGNLRIWWLCQFFFSFWIGQIVCKCQSFKNKCCLGIQRVNHTTLFFALPVII